MSVSYDAASTHRSGIKGLNANPRKPVRGSGTNPAKTNRDFRTKTTIKNVTNEIIKKDQKKMSRPPYQTASSTPISGKKTIQGKTSSTTAKSRARKKATEQLNEEQVALHAYFIAERRRKLGTPGDQTSDWVQAERELLSEIKPKR